MHVLEQIRTSTGTFSLRSDDIIESRPYADFQGKFRLIEAKEAVAAMDTLCKGHPKPLLAYMEDHEIVGEARKYFMENVHVSMSALVGSSYIARMMANLLMNFVKPPIPMKMFADEESALKWIEMTRSRSAAKENASTV